MKNFLKQGGGNLRTVGAIYETDWTPNGEGQAVRTVRANPRWQGVWMQFSPYLGVEFREASKEIGQTWATVIIRFHRSRVPDEGMQILVKETGQYWEITGVNHTDYGHEQLGLTVKLVR